MDPKEKELFDLREELTCRCGCKSNNTDEDFLNKLSFAQSISGIKYTITSGCRCPKHNKDEGGADDSASIFGTHADIDYKNTFIAFLVMKGLLMAGFERIRLYSKHIHVDAHPNHPEPSLRWAAYPVKPEKGV